MHPAIILIDNLNEFSGTEVQALYLARFLQSRRHPVEMWTFRLGTFSKWCQDQGIRVRAFRKTGVLRPDGVRLYREMEAALKAFSGGAPTIIQSFHTASNLLAPVLARRNPNVKVIATRRDMGFIRKPVHDALQRPLNRWISRMVVVSEDVKWIVALREGLDPASIDVIPNGVDSVRFKPATTDDDLARRAALRGNLGVKDGELLLTSVGSMLPRKGHGALIEALARLRGLGVALKLALVGVGEGAADLKALAERRGSGGHVVMTGERTDVPEVLQASDIFALASHTEGFSNAVIEAMAAGLPVVVTDVGGTREAVPRGSGVVVPVNDIPRITEALAALCADEAARREMGERARQVAVDVHNFDRMLEAFLACHTRALAERGVCR